MGVKLLYFCVFLIVWVVGVVIFGSHSMLNLLPAKTIVLMVVLRSELSPRFSVFWGYYVCNHA